MSEPEPSVLETRRHQMFPTLQPAEIGRLRRFGEARSFAAGDALARVGVVSPGLLGRHALETSVSGVFAIGDVRAGSVKRVAASVGEGAQVVAALHGFLSPTNGAARQSVRR